jgi:uncharacterized membrane protein
MSSAFWAEVHGATTHFPVVLALTALAGDAAAVGLWHRPAGPALRVTSPWIHAVAALSTVPAVVSGLVLTRGDLWGEGALRWHHRLVWPAVALVTGAVVWRLLVRDTLSRRGHAAFLSVSAGVALLVVGGARFGGELLQAFP